MRFLFTLYFTLFLSTILFAQSLQQDSVFFMDKAKAYADWLKEIKFSKVLKFEEVEIETDKVKLWLSIKNEKTWHSLKKSYNNENWSSVSEALFFRMVHLFELNKNETVVKITDFNNYYVNIYFEDNQLKIEEPNPKGAVHNNITLPIIELNQKYTKPTTDNVKGNVEYVRKTIEKYLDEYYSAKYARFSSNPAKYKPIDTYGNYIDITISNITDEIVKDRFIGYYEYITIHIKIEQEDEKVKINYSLQGKYGSGVFSAPRRNDYTDMEKDYKEYLNEYNRNLKLNIRNYLLKH